MTYLKAEIAPSPFTSANNVDECMKVEVDEEKKNEHWSNVCQDDNFKYENLKCSILFEKKKI